MTLKTDAEFIVEACSGTIMTSNTKVYPCTNEQLDAVFSVCDFKDKNVLSVLASSDQIFSSYYLGASNVDTFDINIFTKYYYYLRFWSLMYTDIDVPSISKDNLKKILETVSCSSLEEDGALNFWKTVTKRLDDNLIKKMFWPNTTVNRKTTYGDDLEGMRKIMRNVSGPNFTKCNFFDLVSLDKEYDIVVMSNILDYADSIKKLVFCRDNLFELLKDDGKIICSYVVQRDRSKTKGQDEVFSKCFDLIEGGEYISPFDDKKSFPASYVYVKK